MCDENIFTVLEDSIIRGDVLGATVVTSKLAPTKISAYSLLIETVVIEDECFICADVVY